MDQWKQLKGWEKGKEAGKIRNTKMATTRQKRGKIDWRKKITRKKKKKESKWVRNGNYENEETYGGRSKTGWKKRNLELMIKQFRKTIKENINEEMTEWERQFQNKRSGGKTR